MKRAILLISAAVLTAVAGSAQAGAKTHLISPRAALGLHSSAVPQRKQGMVGTWLATYTINGNPVAQTFAQWSKGGTTLQQNNMAPGEGNFIEGNWGGNGSAITSSYIGWGYDSDEVSGYFTKVEQVTLNGDSYSGTFELKIYDLDGNLLADHSGDVSGTRVSF